MKLSRVQKAQELGPTPLSREPLAWLGLLWSGKTGLPVAGLLWLPTTFRPLLADASSQSRAVQGVEALTP